MRHNVMWKRRRLTPSALVLLLGWILLLPIITIHPSAAAAALEATWTPNENDEQGTTGPLPLSTRQRQQLLQLEQTILQSPDPAATLQQAAASNGMEPQELADLLNRNHADMVDNDGGSMAPGGAAARRRPTNVLWQAASGLTAVLGRAAAKHPRAASLFTVTLLVLFYVLVVAIPRTGLVISGNTRGLLTNGPTTAFGPPLPYLERRLSQIRLVQDEEEEEGRSSPPPLGLAKLDAWKTAEKLIHREEEEEEKQHHALEDGATVHTAGGRKRRRRSARLISKQLKQAVSWQTTIDLHDFIDDDDDDSALQDVLEWSLEHAASLLSSRDLTEWAAPHRLRMVSSGDTAILVVKELGDWGRYGLLPLQVTHESDRISTEDSSRRVELVFSTLKGAHFDGQIHVSVIAPSSNEEEDDDDDSSSELRVVVRLLVPAQRGAKAPRLAVATDLCAGLSRSIAASLRTRTQQSAARAKQNTRFTGAARRRARERRHTRTLKEREMEEMAADRRRRWQRGNPNAGAYRPSGDRMRSPNNAVY